MVQKTPMKPPQRPVKHFFSETHLPIPTGKHRVGTVRYDLEDPYRKDLQFPKGRQIPIQICCVEWHHKVSSFSL